MQKQKSRLGALAVFSIIAAVVMAIGSGHFPGLGAVSGGLFAMSGLCVVAQTLTNIEMNRQGEKEQK